MRYELLPELFLRTPFFSYAGYDPDRLPEVLQLPVFRHALRLASPALYAELAKKAFDYSRLKDKERHTLTKYYNRMCFRPTPFGHFAAFSLLCWGGTEPVRLAPNPACRLHLLPEQAPDGGERISLNPSLYRLGKLWRYHAGGNDAHGNYTGAIREMTVGRLPDTLIRELRQESSTSAALSTRIQELSDCTPDEARDFLRLLLAEEVLYDDRRRDVIRQEAPFSLPVPESLPDGNWYAAVERPWQSGGPSAADAAELQDAMEALQRLSVPAVPARLEAFRRAFAQRFDRERVPLLLALDPDKGVAYGDHRPELPAWLAAIPERGNPVAATADREPLRQTLFRHWPGRVGEPLRLTRADLPETFTGAAPNTLAVMYRKAGEQLIFEQATPVSANQLLGRFSAFSPAVEALCRQLAGLEQAANPGVCLADLGQLTESHVDNINRRRPLYAWEIPLNVVSELPAEQQFRLSDLWLSVRGGELILESESLGKRVVPRLASAFNFGLSGSPLFRLLSDLQYQGFTAPRDPDLQQLFPGQTCYPRVVYGRTILRLAKWCFGEADLRELQASGLPAFREKYGLPQWVSWGQTDQQLVFDLTEEREAQFFLDCLKGKASLTLEEYLWPGRSVKSGHRPLAAQYLAFFAHRDAVLPPAAPLPFKASRVTREFLPGSDWLYLKLYLSPAAAERVLQAVIRPLVRRHRARFRCWFFIRYADPEHHLRLRFCLNGPYHDSLLLELRARLKRSGLDALVSQWQTDTYRRELERYGPELIGAVEQVFAAGSDWALLHPEPELALLISLTRAMTGCLLPEPAAQQAFFAEMAERYLTEFKADKKLRRQLDRDYRNWPVAAVLTGAEALTARLSELSRRAGAQRADRRRALLADLIHMQFNRSLVTAQRQQELQVYYGLVKMLAGEQARKR